MIYEKKDGKTVHEYLKGNLCGSGQHFLLLLQRLVPCGGVCVAQTEAEQTPQEDYSA